mmetsp:Transcript_19412/g.18518  ORF Transcript_19412/g.18518 Transcript_19412/m.18518 type:complete len:142 (+) Transcript_19412:1058-1483(+)
MHGLDPQYVYNLAYAEMFNQSRVDSANYTRIIELLEYAASRGEIVAINGLAIIYMDGYLDDITDKWIITPNLTYAMELLHNASLLNDLDATMNLASIYLHGKMGFFVNESVPKNITKAVTLLEQAVKGSSPLATHMFGEVV